MEYMQKADETIKMNDYFNIYNMNQRKSKHDLQRHYFHDLQEQIKEKETNLVKQTKMNEEEKKFHLGSSLVLPSFQTSSSNNINAFVSPTNNRKTLEGDLFRANEKVSSIPSHPYSDPIGYGSPKQNLSVNHYSSPLKSQEVHNPITNPIPENVQNPYFLRRGREFRPSASSQNNIFANVASHNLVNAK